MTVWKLLIGCCAFGMATSAFAQDIPGFERDAQRDVRASVGITIPFGGASRERADMQPRFDVIVETGESDWQSQARNLDNPLTDSRRNVRQGRMSLTFEEEPRFLLNGESFSEPYVAHADGQDAEGAEEQGEERRGRNTLQKIGLGAAILGGVAVLGAAYFWIRIGTAGGGGE